jgi:GNAT superfamily N-acetyltransferase
MIRPDLLNIPQASFPEGFSMRPMHLDEMGLWTDIQRHAEPYFEIPDALFYQQFGQDLQAIQWRCFIITNEKGVGVGTISAWYDLNFKGQDYGRVHWVATRPAYQRKGLAKAGLSFVLNQLAQWHQRCYLDTATKRLPAIKLYLDFGFLPDLDQPNAIKAWGEVRDSLAHPVLQNMQI